MTAAMSRWAARSDTFNSGPRTDAVAGALPWRGNLNSGLLLAARDTHNHDGLGGGRLAWQSPL